MYLLFDWSMFSIHRLISLGIEPFGRELFLLSTITQGTAYGGSLSSTI